MNTNSSQVISSTSKPLVFFEIAKSASISLLAFASSLIGMAGIFTSLTASELTVEPIKVPTLFSEFGYSSEITTTRILDEVVRINAISTSGIERTNLGGKQPGQVLANMQSLPLPGIGSFGFREIQEIIQGLFGIKNEKISGEITFTKEDNRTTYHVRVRQMPENKLLVDFSSDADIPEVVNKIAIKIVEKMDPVVAASYYRWNHDIERSLLMLDQALRAEGDYDDYHALADRAQIYILLKKFNLAQIDLDRIFKENPEFPMALVTQGFLHNEKKEYDKGLVFAKKAKKHWPESWVPFNLAGVSYEGLNRGDEAEAAYIETIKRAPSWWISYDEIAAFHIKRNRSDLAEHVLNRGLSKFPDNVNLLTRYANLLLSLNRKEQALNYLSKAHMFDPNNIQIWMTVLGVDDYKNEPLVLAIKKLAFEKVKAKPADPDINKLKTLLKE